MKKTLTISLFIFTFFSHAAVIKVTDNQDNKDLTQLAGDGKCSLREAIHAANTDTKVDACSAGNGRDYIKFDQPISSIILDGKELTVSDTLDIAGLVENTVTINANKKSRIFNHKDNSGFLRLFYLKLENGQAPPNEGGGAIKSQDSMYLKSIHFDNNRVLGVNANGGAVHNNGGFDAVKCKFTNNTSEWKGGAIYADNYNKIVRTVFENNRAKTEGGAIYYKLRKIKSIRARVENSIFRHNHSKINGGALYVDSEPETRGINVVSSSFTHNIADNKGGAIYSNAHYLFLSNTTFGENQAKITGGIFLNSGTEKKNVRIVHTTIFKNKSTGVIQQADYLKVSSGLYVSKDINIVLDSNVIGSNRVHVDDPNSRKPIEKLADCYYSQKPYMSKNNLVSSNTHACGLVPKDNFIGNDPKLSDLITTSTRCRIKVGLSDQAQSCTDFYEPKSDSVTIDNASLASHTYLSEDQIGLLRNFDGNNDKSANPDIGAIEFGAVERNKKIILNRINVMDGYNILLNGALINAYGELSKPRYSQITLNFTVGKGESFTLSIQHRSNKQICTFSNGMKSIDIIANSKEDDVIVDLTCITKVGKQFSDSFE